MPPQPNDPPPDPDILAGKVARLETRLARIESYLRLDEPTAAASGTAATGAKTEEELEFTVGQDWFARAGIAALGLGIAFTLSLPYRALPPAVPALLGYLLAAALFVLAGRCSRPFELLSSQLRAVAMALGYFASLRLCFFGARHALSADSIAGEALLALTAGVNLVIALRRKSTWLFGLALATGYVTALAVGSPGFALGAIALLSIVAVIAGASLGRPGMTLAAMPLGYAAYVVWALNEPWLGRPVQAAAPPWAPGVVLVCLVAFASGLRRWTRDGEDHASANAGSLLNAAVGYGIFLLHTLVSFQPWFAADQLAAAAVLVALAVRQARGQSGVGPFVYAMTGFLALSFAIIKATAAPDVFVWLSLQSVIVVATAIWLRSRFIIVANFIIYLAILAGYVAVARTEHGISLGFGLVALVTARLLGWKQERLELKTELMRNAYLVVALLVFPYGLYHLVPDAWVGLAWVGAALLYYVIGTTLRNRKYRWMGHATLLLTALYLIVVGVNRLEPLYRNLSFLVLGAVLLTVSLVFTRLRPRGR